MQLSLLQSAAGENQLEAGQEHKETASLKWM
jgi:hypothetical protein